MAAVSLPFIAKKPLQIPPIVSVELIQISNKTNIASSPMRRLMSFVLLHKQRFYWSVIASCLNKVLDLMPPLLVAWVIDTVNRTPPAWIQGFMTGSTPWDMALFLAGLAVVIFGLESLFQWAYQYGFMTLSQHVQHQLRCDTYRQLQDREMAFFENHRLGNTLTILNDDINQLERFLNSSFNEIVQLVILVIF